MLIDPRRHHELAVAHVRVDFGPHADLAWDVHPGLDREGNARYEQSLFAGLEVIEVRSRAVKIARVNRVARPVHEPVTESSRRDHGAGSIVGITTANIRCSRDALAQKRD